MFSPIRERCVRRWPSSNGPEKLGAAAKLNLLYIKLSLYIYRIIYIYVYIYLCISLLKAAVVELMSIGSMAPTHLSTFFFNKDAMLERPNGARAFERCSKLVYENLSPKVVVIGARGYSCCIASLLPLSIYIGSELPNEKSRLNE